MEKYINKPPHALDSEEVLDMAIEQQSNDLSLYWYQAPQVLVTSFFTIDDFVSNWCFEFMEHPKLSNTTYIVLFVEREKLCTNLGFVLYAIVVEEESYIIAKVEKKAKVTIFNQKLLEVNINASLMMAS